GGAVTAERGRVEPLLDERADGAERAAVLALDARLALALAELALGLLARAEHLLVRGQLAGGHLAHLAGGRIHDRDRGVAARRLVVAARDRLRDQLLGDVDERAAVLKAKDRHYLPPSTRSR